MHSCFCHYEVNQVAVLLEMMIVQQNLHFDVTVEVVVLHDPPKSETATPVRYVVPSPTKL